jgi:hypothetical protein
MPNQRYELRVATAPTHNQEWHKLTKWTAEEDPAVEGVPGTTDGFRAKAVLLGMDPYADDVILEAIEGGQPFQGGWLVDFGDRKEVYEVWSYDARGHRTN